MFTSRFFVPKAYLIDNNILPNETHIKDVIINKQNI